LDNISSEMIAVEGESSVLRVVIKRTQL